MNTLVPPHFFSFQNTEFVRTVILLAILAFILGVILLVPTPYAGGGIVPSEALLPGDTRNFYVP